MSCSMIPPDIFLKTALVSASSTVNPNNLVKLIEINMVTPKYYIKLELISND